MIRVTLFFVLIVFINVQGEEKLFQKIESNKWIKVVEDKNGGSPYQAIIYDPIHSSVMQWANVPTNKHLGSLAYVRHFSLDLNKWVADYPPIKGGKTLSFATTWFMKDGYPLSAHNYDMVAYNAKKQIFFYSFAGLDLEYDSRAKKWFEVKSEIELFGRKFPGGPPVQWGAMCYDPINDEYVSFSHGGVINYDDLDTSGVLSGHLGTVVYSNEHKTWNRLMPGSENFKAMRKLLNESWVLYGKVVALIWKAEKERAWDNNRFSELTHEAKSANQKTSKDILLLIKGIDDYGNLLTDDHEKNVYKEITKILESIKGNLENVARCLENNSIYEAYVESFHVTQTLRHSYRFKLLAEPPERLNSKMVYDPVNECLLMFGGNHADGCWNDTWIYNCKNKKWRKSKSKNRPPARQESILVYSNRESKFILCGGSEGVWKPFISDLWSFDVKDDQWVNHPMAEKLVDRGAHRYLGDLDQSAHCIVMHRGDYSTSNGITWLLKPDISASIEAPHSEIWYPDLPEPYPQPDNEDVLKELSKMKENVWIDANSNFNPPRKEWGNLGYDSSTGFALLFGGGHSSYQCDDIIVYFPGSNKWAYSHSPMSAAILPQLKKNMGGGLSGVNFNGGFWTMHQRNTYDAINEIMVLSLINPLSFKYGPSNVLDILEKSKTRWPEWQNALWEYDLVNRVWKKVFPKGSSDRMFDLFSGKNKIYSLQENSWAEYEPGAKEIIFNKINYSLPTREGEGKHYTYLRDSNRVFLVINSKTEVPKTFTFDLTKNTLSEIETINTLPKSYRIYNVHNVAGQAGVWVWLYNDDVKKIEQWVYSFEKNSWINTGLSRIEGHKETGPIEQVIYSEKYKIFIWAGGGGPTAIMKPNIAKLNFGGLEFK